MLIFTLLIIIFFVIIFKLISKNKKLEGDYHSLIVDIQSTKKIETKKDYQERVFVTKLKNHTIHTDMDDSRSYTIQEND